jgi:hypothetical protein
MKISISRGLQSHAYLAALIVTETPNNTFEMGNMQILCVMVKCTQSN